MRFVAAADTDIGTIKNTNQDSIAVKHASSFCGEIMMAMICDGMGGLFKGELASATVIRAFSRWFDEELPYELENLNMQVIGDKWAFLLKELNAKILRYGNAIGKSLGTTCTVLLCVGTEYLIMHVGDTRVYHIGSSVCQLTMDQTFVAREVRRGTMTAKQAKVDERRSLLLQCVGASNVLEPQVIYGTVSKGAYLICSDGFCHEITEEEMYASLNPINLMNKESMRTNVRYLINQIKMRKERDNISAILIKVDEGDAL